MQSCPERRRACVRFDDLDSTDNVPVEIVQFFGGPRALGELGLQQTERARIGV